VYAMAISDSVTVPDADDDYDEDFVDVDVWGCLLYKLLFYAKLSVNSATTFMF
jgi:hypothetical protein